MQTQSLSAQPTVGPQPALTAFSGRSFSYTFSATGGTPPYVWKRMEMPSNVPFLPDSFRLNPTSGELSGLADESLALGNYAVGIQVTDAAGANTNFLAAVRVDPTKIALSPVSSPSSTVDLTVTYLGRPRTQCLILVNGVHWGTFANNSMDRSIYRSVVAFGPPGVYPVILQCPAFESDPALFTVTAPTAAVITSVAPASKEYLSPPEPLIVRGSGFSTSDVIWLGQSQLPTTFISSSELRTTVAEGSPGRDSGITVRSSNGTLASLPFAFSFTIPRPTIVSLVPAVVPAGGADFDLQVLGTDFLRDADVRWSETRLTILEISRTRIVARVPAGLLTLATSVPITVRNAPFTGFSIDSTSVTFTIRTPTSGGSAFPSSVLAGSAATTLQIRGSGFSPGQLVYWADRNGSTIPLATAFVSSSQLDAVVPASLLLYPLSTRLCIGLPCASANSVPFDVTTPLPVLTSVTPESIVAGSLKGITLTVNGSGFLPGVTTFYWNGQALVQNSASPTQLLVSVGSDLLVRTGTATIWAETPGAPRSNTLTIALSSAPLIQAVVNAASGRLDSISPQQLVTIYGLRMGPATPVTVQVGTDGALPTVVNGYSVSFNGVGAPLLYWSDTQINAITPAALPVPGSEVKVSMSKDGSPLAEFSVSTRRTAPGIFTTDGQNGIVINQDGTLNNDKNPAARGSVIVLYGTGGGATVPALADGRPSGLPLAQLAQSMTAWINTSTPAEVLYAGPAPGFAAGLLQINIRIPDNIPGLNEKVRLQVFSGNEPSNLIEAYVQ